MQVFEISPFFGWIKNKLNIKGNLGCLKFCLNFKGQVVSKELHIVGYPWVILIDSLFHHPWVHLVKFACFPSNIHDLFLPNEITCYICMSLFSFGGALFKPIWRNQHVLSWNVMKLRAFLQLFYSPWLRKYQ